MTITADIYGKIDRRKLDPMIYVRPDSATTIDLTKWAADPDGFLADNDFVKLGTINPDTFALTSTSTKTEKIDGNKTVCTEKTGSLAFDINQYSEDMVDYLQSLDGIPVTVVMISNYYANGATIADPDVKSCFRTLVYSTMYNFKEEVNTGATLKLPFSISRPIRTLSLFRSVKQGVGWVDAT